MFVRASTLVLAIAASVIAAPGSTTTPATVNSSQCDTGNLQCCTGTTPASSITDTIAGLLGLSGVILPIDSLVNTGCTPITVIGTGSGANCQQEPVCCSNINENGLVNVACSPFTLNL